MSLVVLPLLALALPQGSSGFIRYDMPSTSVAMTFFLDEEGVVLDCQVDFPDVSEERAERLCADTIGKHAGEPATGPDGQPAPGIISMSRVRATSAARERMDAVFGPDFELQVSRLPSDAKRMRVGLAVYIDETGALKNCQQSPGSDLELSRIACENASRYGYRVRANAEGNPVGYVTSLSTEFILDQSES